MAVPFPQPNTIDSRSTIDQPKAKSRIGVCSLFGNHADNGSRSPRMKWRPMIVVDQLYQAGDIIVGIQENQGVGELLTRQVVDKARSTDLFREDADFLAYSDNALAVRLILYGQYDGCME